MRLYDLKANTALMIGSTLQNAANRMLEHANSDGYHGSPRDRELLAQDARELATYAEKFMRYGHKLERINVL